MKALAIALIVDGLPESRVPPGCVYIPMTMEARAALDAQRMAHFAPPSRLDMCDHLLLQSDVDARFSEMCASNSRARLYSQLFAQLTSSALAYRLVIGRLIHREAPKMVLIPCRPLSVEAAERDESDVRRRALAAILAEVGTNEFRPAEFPDMGVNAQTFSARLLEGCVSAAVRARWGVLRLRRVLREAVLRRRSRMSLLVVGDTGKRWVLERYGVDGARCTFVSAADMQRKQGPGQCVPCNSVTLDLVRANPDDGIAAFVSDMADANIEALDSAAASIASSFDGLLTCAEDDPLVRRTLDAFRARGKPVWIFPEGAVDLDEEYWPFYRLFHYSEAECGRLAVSDEDRDFWLRNGWDPAKVRTVGYLGDTTASSRVEDLIVWLWWCIHRRLDRMARGRSPVFLSYEVLEDHGLTRLGVPGEADMMASCDEAVQALIADNKYVIVKARSSLVAGIARQRYADLPVFVTHRIPWQVLARLTGGVVTRESSLSREALSIGLYVIVWNPHPLRSRCESLARPDSKRVTVARSVTELTEGVRGMVSSNRSRHAERDTRNSLRNALRDWSAHMGWSR